MPSPLGHTIVSSSIYLFFNRNFNFRQDWKSLISCVIIGLLPDADLILVVLAQDTGLHRSVSHNLLFVIVASLFVSLGYRFFKIFDFKKTFLLIFCLLSMHLFLDFFTLDEILHFGINLFYPFTDEYIAAPFYLFLGFDWRKPSVLFSPYMAEVFLREFLVTFPLLALALLYQKKSTLGKVG